MALVLSRCSGQSKILVNYTPTYLPHPGLTQHFARSEKLLLMLGLRRVWCMGSFLDATDAPF